MHARPLALLLLACSSTALGLGLGQITLGSEKAAAADSWEWASCGEPSDAVQIKSISVSPDPPKIGADLTVTVDLDVVETIEEGTTADVLVKVGRIKLLQKTFDICEEARNANATISCPLSRALKYQIHVDVFTPEPELEPAACVDLTVTFRPFFQVWD
ncbi:hypothetical protein B0H14DRAFT_2692147 [Mycena olivaceomarginata]|nr:hypothetical protein B0H14DRAFT_2692147 [Mycena olivaceomarginata]